MKAALFAAALLCVAAPALAQEPEARAMPDYAPGDAFVFTDGRVEQVMRAEGDVVTWRGLQGDAYERGRNFVTPVIGWKNSQGEGRRTVAGPAGKLWPLAPGKSARFSVITESRRAGAQAWERNLALWACHVEASRAVQTPAGGFEVLPIVCDRFSPVNMRLLERLTWDYAPEVGHYVRRTIVDYVSAQTSVIALTSELHGQAATRPRLEALADRARASGPPSLAR